jgi:hypothetical protein
VALASNREGRSKAAVVSKDPAAGNNRAVADPGHNNLHVHRDQEAAAEEDRGLISRIPTNLNSIRQ